MADTCTGAVHKAPQDGGSCPCGAVTSVVRAFPHESRELREAAQEALEPDVTTLARALFDIGLTSVGPDDLDNRQIAQRLLAGGYVRVASPTVPGGVRD